MIIVTGSIVAKEGCLAQALELSLEHVQRSRTEPGCISHAVHLDAEHPARLFFFERWVDDAALAAHFALPASRAFAKSLVPLLAETAQLAVFDAQPR